MPAESDIQTERQDTIERTITVSASVERVWLALTAPDELSQWFGDTAEVDLRPGGTMRVGWSEYDAVAECIVESVEEPSRFCFRWTSGADEHGDVWFTTVCFSLASDGDHTTVTMVESGLAALPDELHARTVEENSSGWDAELEDLRGYLEGGAAG